METTVERLEGNLVRLSVTVPASDVDAAIEKAYRDVSSKLRIPGFRAGKAPRPIIDSHVGPEAVLAEAQEDLVQFAYTVAIDAEGVRPIESPDMGELDSLVAGEPFTFVAEISVRPEFPLTSLDDLVVYTGPRETTDAEIEAQINHARERFATLETVERPVQADDFVLLSFVGTVDGETYEGNTVDKYLYEMNHGLMPEEFDAALSGASAGDEVVSEFMIPDESSNPEFVGKQARFEVTVHEVKAKVMPAIDDAFAASVGGFDTIDEMRNDIRKKFDESKAAGHVQRVELLARELIASRLDGEIPEVMIKSRVSTMTRDFFENLEERGITLANHVEATGVQVDQIQSDLAVQATVRVGEELALESLFRLKGMVVTEDDFHAAVLELAGGEPDGVEQVLQSISASGVTPIVKESIVHQKALEWLLANVEVREEEAAAPEDKKAKKAAPKRKSAKAATAEEE
ncbi:MAG: trigger factor [Actinomycetota bacterium]|nr:trigger factor [Actinomycetota bacterium]